ncbi:outer membrane beta-barrel protein [Sphingomonas sp. So64.6b]|uniref:outer membrane protein n=1 Tax=Sphingomonas sp. So64.6b TaxID=2997354 RepID=UPI001603F61C|nr:outer membrane beta-barrel protein [Sphingomonas sp. So64.6b]QNA85214.1 outer membrane beta-barrel protein [Sphingomonas sp. So64.6b]
MRTYLTLATAMAAIFLSTAAYAQDDSGDDTGFYAGLSVGLASVQDTDIRYYDAGGTFGGTGAMDSVDGHIDTKSAAEFKGVLGYDFGMIRGDLEVAYQRNKASALTIDKVNGSAVTLDAGDAADVCDYLEATGCSVSGNTIAFGGGSRVRQLTAMANLWVDVPVGKVVTPYVGGGVGVAGFEIDGEGKARFAWQVGAGVAFKLSDHVALTADFRHREAKGGNLPYDASSGFTVGKIHTNSVSAGVRFTF